MQKPLFYVTFFDRKESDERNSPSGTTFANQLYGFDLNRQTRYVGNTIPNLIYLPPLKQYRFCYCLTYIDCSLRYARDG